MDYFAFCFSGCLLSPAFAHTHYSLQMLFSPLKWTHLPSSHKMFSTDFNPHWPSCNSYSSIFRITYFYLTHNYLKYICFVLLFNNFYYVFPISINVFKLLEIRHLTMLGSLIKLTWLQKYVTEHILYQIPYWTRKKWTIVCLSTHFFFPFATIVLVRTASSHKYWCSTTDFTLDINRPLKIDCIDGYRIYS